MTNNVTDYVISAGIISLYSLKRGLSKMKIFCMSDIHGCLAAFNAALDRVVGSLN